MIIDGNDLKTIAVLKDRPGSRSAASVKQIVAGAPGAWRRVRMGRGAPDPLQVVCRGWVVGDPNDMDGGTPAQMRANLDQLKFWTRPDKELIITWSDISGRQWYGYREELSIGGVHPEWTTPATAFALRIICPMPYAQETTPQTDDTSGAAPRVLTPSVGTAPMPILITITGSSSNLVNPVLHYRDKNNSDIHTLSYAGTLTAAQTLVINTEAMTAVLNGSTNVAGDMSGVYFDVNPGDGDYLGSPNGPDVQLTADSGSTDDFQLDWARRYL